jgi:hypothetical protein
MGAPRDASDFTRGLQRAASPRLRGAAHPLVDVVLEPDGAGAQTCDGSWEVFAGGIAGRGSSAHAKHFGHFRQSHEPELHASTLNGNPEDPIFMT